MTKKHQATPTLHKAIDVCATIFLIIFSVMAAISFIYPAKLSSIQYPAIVIGVAILLIYGTIKLLQASVAIKPVWYWCIVTGLFVLSFGLLCIMAYSLFGVGYTWDVATVQHVAIARMSGYIPENTWLARYMAVYPNNIAIVYLLIITMKFGALFGLQPYSSALVLNIALIFLTQIAIFAISYRLYGKKIALLSIFLSSFYTTFSVYAATPYTDTIGMFFIASALLLFVFGYKNNNVYCRYAFLATCFVLIGIGVLIKPTVLFIGVGLLVICTLDGIKNKRFLKTAGLMALLVLAVALPGLILPHVYNSYRLTDASYAEFTKNSMIPLHYVAMGIQKSDKTDVWGGINLEYVQKAFQAPTKQQKTKLAEHYINKTLQKNGVFGQTAFFAKKMNWIMSDGTFYAWKEGDSRSIKFVYKTPLANSVRSVFYAYGKYYGIYQYVAQTFWVVILMSIMMQLWFTLRDKKRMFLQKNDMIFGLYATIGILLMYLMIFEGRSRYLYLYLPVFTVVALGSFSWITRSSHQK